MKAPLQELTAADLVVLEVPPITEQNFECNLLNLTYKIRNLGPEVLIVVQPSLRRKSNKSIWVHRWNQMPHAPFKFTQTCSCKTGNTIPG